MLEAVGPDHEKVFRVAVSVGGEVLGMGIGPSRRVAETAAAAEAVEVLAARMAEQGESLTERAEELTEGLAEAAAEATAEATAEASAEGVR